MNHTLNGFTKMLSDLDSEHSPEFLIIIYFLNSDPDSVKNRMLYISTDLNKNITETALVDDLWSVSKLGVPDWSKSFPNANKASRFFKGIL